ncbi:MAG: hypothetical protein ACRCUY_01835 [Thermoguttaceae bacterium]
MYRKQCHKTQIISAPIVSDLPFSVNATIICSVHTDRQQVFGFDKIDEITAGKEVRSTALTVYFSHRGTEDTEKRK